MSVRMALSRLNHDAFERMRRIDYAVHDTVCTFNPRMRIFAALPLNVSQAAALDLRGSIRRIVTCFKVVRHRRLALAEYPNRSLSDIARRDHRTASGSVCVATSAVRTTMRDAFSNQPKGGTQ